MTWDRIGVLHHLLGDGVPKLNDWGRGPHTQFGEGGGPQIDSWGGSPQDRARDDIWGGAPQLQLARVSPNHRQTGDRVPRS